MIYVTTTATLREEMRDSTYFSFFEKMLKKYRHNLKLVINIDPVGPGDVDRVKNIAESYFPNSVIINTPPIANFSRAFIWTWQQVNIDSCAYVLNLEDDWELTQYIDILDMMDILSQSPTLASLRIPAFRSTENNMKNWTKFFPWNGRYFECPTDMKQDVGFCGHPSFIKAEFVKNTSDLLIPTINPEKQFHGDNPKLVAEVLKWNYGVYGFPNKDSYIRDMGRDWMVRNGLRKSGNKAWFTCWEKYNG